MYFIIKQTVKNNSNLGGIMLWDASFDMNNFINGKPYSSIMRSIMDGTYKDDVVETSTNDVEDHCIIFVVRVVGTHHTIRVRYVTLYHILIYSQSICSNKNFCQRRCGSKMVAKFFKESILIAFDFIWRVLLSDRNYLPPF